MVGSLERRLLVGGTLIALLISGWSPYHRSVWLLEVSPVLVGLPLLIATRARFPLTQLVYRLLFVHALVLIVGGHYSYARVPLGFWLQEVLELSRNPYDRIGHLAQGFVPALVVRELLLRHTALRRGAWLVFLVASVCLALSAFYELLEWWTALLAREAAETFLAMQGDVWDTQWDMFCALVGAGAALASLSRLHDAALGAAGIRVAQAPCAV